MYYLSLKHLYCGNVADIKETPTPFLSPTELIKNKSVNLLFENIGHNAHALKDDEKYAFYCKTKDLSILLERYTPRSAREELKQWFAQLDAEIKEIKKVRSLTPQARDKKILELNHNYALEVHAHNQRILMNSPIIELDVEGELDVSDPGVVNVVRGGKRSDAKDLIFKQ